MSESTDMTTAQQSYTALMAWEIYGLPLTSSQRKGMAAELERLTAKMKTIGGREHKLEKRYRAALKGRRPDA